MVFSHCPHRFTLIQAPTSRFSASDKGCGVLHVHKKWFSQVWKTWTSLDRDQISAPSNRTVLISDGLPSYPGRTNETFSSHKVSLFTLDAESGVSWTAAETEQDACFSIWFPLPSQPAGTPKHLTAIRTSRENAGKQTFLFGANASWLWSNALCACNVLQSAQSQTSKNKRR